MFILLHSLIRHNFMFILSFECKHHILCLCLCTPSAFFMFHLSYTFYLLIGFACTIHVTWIMILVKCRILLEISTINWKFLDVLWTTNSSCSLRLACFNCFNTDYLFRNIFSLFQIHCRMLPNLISYYSYFNNLV